MTRNRRLSVGGFIGVLVLGTVVSTVFGLESRRQTRKVEEREIETLSQLSDNLIMLKQPFDALKEALKAGGKLQKANWVEGDTRFKAISDLRQYLFGVKEFNSLDKHSGPVRSIAFSPDGKTLASASEDNTVILWNFDLDDLVAQSCDWLHDYLVSHPEEEELREICEVR